jgi:hypothetical protein
MIEQLITKETFELAKLKGFDVYICRCGGFPDCICNHDNLLPTQAIVQKWLRDKHRLHVEVKPWKSEEDIPTWHAQVFTLKLFNVSFQSFEYVTMFSYGKEYEEALEKGIISALNCIKDNGR